MYPFVNLPNIVLPSIDSLIDQTMLSLFSPMFDVFPAAASGEISSDSSSPNSSINTVGKTKKVRATPKSAGGPMRNKRQRLEFCNVCQKNITDEGKRSQGPRRHVLQHHLCRPIFFCPLCPATSNYDKAHIRTHMQRMHKGIEGEVIEVEKKMFAEEEDSWFKRCFGEGSESRQRAASDEKVTKEVKVEIKAEQEDEDEVKENLSIPLLPVLFSIDRILSGRTKTV